MKNKTFLIFLIIYLLLLLILIDLNVHIIRPHVEDIDQITIEIYDGFGNCSLSGNNLINIKNVGNEIINLSDTFFVIWHQNNSYDLKLNISSSKLDNNLLRPNENANFDIHERYNNLTFARNITYRITGHKNFWLGPECFKGNVILF